MSTDVLIAGAGPSGMTLALELSRRGVSCRIVDKASGPLPTSRAIAVQPRTLELLDQMGIASEIERRGVPQTGIRISSGNRLLAHLPHGRFAYEPTCLPQVETETVLRDALKRQGVEIEWGFGLDGFEQKPDGVLANLTSGTASARWLVGCDGAHSAVRHGMGVEFKGAALPETNLMADVKLDWDLDGGDVRIWFHPEGVLVALHQPGNVWRLIASVREPDRRPTEPFFAEVLERRAGIRPAHMQILWMSAFVVHTRLASTYRDRRVFLTGDAAHVHSPVGGQGMNLGIQDSVNLGWKLADAIKGAPDRLLDTYEAERRPVAKQVIRATEPLTRIGIASSPVKRFVRDHLLPVVLNLPPVRRSMAQQASGVGLSYSRSPLSMKGCGDRAPFRRGYYSGSWELFRGSDGSGVLVRPDAYVAARFDSADGAPAERYLKEWTSGADLVIKSRELPSEDPARTDRVGGAQITRASR
ncbi:MAG: FAD-dependent monooxygenase [Candidatus Dormibacteraceae bacterium]